MAALISFARMQSPEPPKIYGTVVVVGGGNTAVDAARTSLRIGAEKVVHPVPENHERNARPPDGDRRRSRGRR